MPGIIIIPRFLNISSNSYSCLSSLLRKLLGGAFTTASASPTCRRSVTSRELLLSLLRMLSAEEVLAWAVLNCYWRGSDDEDRRFRWR